MRVLSLFDGISCGRLALGRAGVSVSKYYSSEIDKYALQISSKNFPQDNADRLGDICKITKDLIPDGVDLIIGGSPCQSLSRSGDGSGFDGKSKLFWEFVRVLKDFNPKYFLLENVEMKKEWEDVITKELGVEPIHINSSDYSAQKRPRVYWTNIPISQMKPSPQRLEDILIGGSGEIINNHPVVLKKEGGEFTIKNATKLGYLLAKDGDCVNLEVPNSKTRRGRVSSGKTNTLNTACNYGVVEDGNLRTLCITEYERLQNLPDGYTVGVSEYQRKKMIGNGWTVDVIADIFRGLKYEK